jgi:outer membrane autotransporter protein
MLDQTDSNDSVNINGTYDSGWNSGILSVDSNLGLNGVSDKLYITGIATGLTHVTVNDLSAGSASAYNPDGMMVVNVQGELQTTDGIADYAPQQLFTLNSGPIDKGFFDYDLYYGVNDTGHSWYLRNAPNVRAYELPKIATAAQEVWYESSNAWKDRAVGMRSLLTSAESDQSMPSGPSVWIRAFGAKNDRNTSNQISTASGTVIADTGYDQRTSGFVAGIDSKVIEGEDSGSLLFGYMAGYTHSTLDFDNSGSNADIQGVNLGAYTSYANKGFFLDALIKFDHHDIDYKTNFLATDNSQSFNGRSFGALLNAGYRIGSFPGTQGLFFEPSFSLARVVSNFDNFRMLNSDVEINKAGSTRSRLGARYGNTWASEGLINEAYVDIGANWESDLNNSAILSNGTNSVSVSDKRDGNFGDIALGLNLIDTGSGLSGFAKAQHRFHNEQKVSGVQFGIRYKF